jgi:hypothetical protein
MRESVADKATGDKLSWTKARTQVFDASISKNSDCNSFPVVPRTVEIVVFRGEMGRGCRLKTIFQRAFSTRCAQSRYIVQLDTTGIDENTVSLATALQIITSASATNGSDNTNRPYRLFSGSGFGKLEQYHQVVL